MNKVNNFNFRKRSFKDWLRGFVCNHSYRHVTNIHGDVIDMISSSKTFRSAWQCGDCGKIYYSGILYKCDKYK